MHKSLRDRASDELDNAGIDGGDKHAVMDILDLFFERFDSGGAVSTMAPILARLISGFPLTPLTGLDHEWEDMSAHEDAVPGTIFQNNRATTVFKRQVVREIETGLILRSGHHSASSPRQHPERFATRTRAEIDEAVASGKAVFDWVYFDVSSSGTGYNDHKEVTQFPYLPEPSVSDPVVVLPGSQEG